MTAIHLDNRGTHALTIASADKSKALLNERYSSLEWTRVRPWHL